MRIYIYKCKYKHVGHFSLPLLPDSFFNKLRKKYTEIKKPVYFYKIKNFTWQIIKPNIKFIILNVYII